MSKISKIWSPSHNIWYDELRQIDPYREYEYDRSIQSHLKTLFPEYFGVGFNLKVKKNNAIKASIPDFVLIREDYKEWWIVEVERIEDRLKHVKEQIDNFTNGYYNSVIVAEHLHKNNSKLDLKKLKILVQELPSVLLIVDDIDSTWINELKEFEPSICVLKQYRSREGKELFSISGDYPYIYEETSFCKFSHYMENLIEIHNPDVLEPLIDKTKYSFFQKALRWVKRSDENDNRDIYEIYHQGHLSEWKVIRVDDKTYLQPIGPHALRSNDLYQLKRTTKKTYIIELN